MPVVVSGNFPHANATKLCWELGGVSYNEMVSIVKEKFGLNIFNSGE